MTFHLAQLNIGRLLHPLDAAETAEFVAALDPVNQIAEAAPGFVWRLTGDDGQSSSFVDLPGVDDPLMISNYSVWVDLESLKHFMYKTDHAAYLPRRREWFAKLDEAATVCFWIPQGDTPSLGEAYARLEHLRTHGPSPMGWPLNKPFAQPS